MQPTIPKPDRLLAAVAGKTRVMEDEFIAPSGTDVTDAFRLYLRPLLGSRMPTRSGCVIAPSLGAELIYDLTCSNLGLSGF